MEQSFSQKVKTELAAIPLTKPELILAECYGALLHLNRFSATEIRLLSKNPDVCARMEQLMQKLFGFGFTQVSAHSYRITCPEQLSKIAAKIGYDQHMHISHSVNLGLLEEKGTAAAFLRGAFLTGGAVTNPQKSYQLELTSVHSGVSRGMISLLQEQGLSPLDSVRRGNFVVYFKKSDAIADFLTMIGATNAALSHMTAKVEKHMQNAISRKVNCDTANVGKTVAAAGVQIAAIRKIEQLVGLDTLPEHLQELALLRMMNPEVSLFELAELSDPPLTKSGVSHRMRKLVEIANNLVE